MATEFERAATAFDLGASLLRLEARAASRGLHGGLVRARSILCAMMDAEKDETRWMALRDARRALEGEIDRAS